MVKCLYDLVTIIGHYTLRHTIGVIKLDCCHSDHLDSVYLSARAGLQRNISIHIRQSCKIQKKKHHVKLYQNVKMTLRTLGL